MKQVNRSSFVIFAPEQHLRFYEKNPSYKGAIYFNHLLDHLRREPTKAFNKKLNKWLQYRLVYGEKTYSLANLFDEPNVI